jgi:hypothetical protein
LVEGKRSKKEKTHFVVTYRDPVQDKNVSMRVEKVSDSSLGLSFIQLSGFIFETSNIVVNPDEEALAKRFENTKSLHLSIYSILSIEEVGLAHRGLAFESDKSNLVVLPSAQKPSGPSD